MMVLIDVLRVLRLYLLALAVCQVDPSAIRKGQPLALELEQEIRNAIDRLPEECKVVFKKSRFEEKRYEQIAEELGISVNTVKYHIKNAISRLNADLSKYLLLLICCFWN